MGEEQVAVQPRRVAWSLLVGLILGLIPYIVGRLFPNPASSGLLRDATDILSVPGYLVAVVVARGVAEDANLVIWTLVDVAFYSLLTYAVIALVDHLRRKRSNDIT
jgi:hypothetical protein